MMHHATARLPEADHVRLEAIAKTYAPYDRFPAFWQGVEDYLRHPIASVPGFLISSEISLTTVSSRVVEQIR